MSEHQPSDPVHPGYPQQSLVMAPDKEQLKDDHSVTLEVTLFWKRPPWWQIVLWAVLSLLWVGVVLYVVSR